MLSLRSRSKFGVIIEEMSHRVMGLEVGIAWNPILENFVNHGV